MSLSTRAKSFRVRRSVISTWRQASQLHKLRLAGAVERAPLPVELGLAFQRRLQAVENALPADPLDRRRADAEDGGDVRIGASAVLATPVGQQEQMGALAAFRRPLPAVHDFPQEAALVVIQFHVMDLSA